MILAVRLCTRQILHIAPSNGPRAGRLPLVGREKELLLLQALVAGAREGAGSMLFLSGESGVGKTRLVERLVEEATEQGCLPLVGHAFPAEGAFPFALAADALSQLVRALGPNTVTLLSRGHENDLAMILPTLAKPGAPTERPTGGDAKARVFWHVERFLRKASEQKPIILILENVQWADESSLELLHFLLRQLSGARVSALCTYNSQEREMTPGLRAAERSLKRAGRAESHEMLAFTRAEVGELVRQAKHLGDRATEAFADLLFERTLGNPFFVEELIATSGEAGETADLASWANTSAAGALPSSVRDAVLARAAALEAPERAALDCVAAMGMRAPLGVVSAVTGISRDDLGAVVTTLAARGLLDEHSDDAGLWYECRHPLVRATLYDVLGRTRAQALHARIAEAFQQLQAGDETAFVNEIAWHYSRAGDALTSPKATRFLALAGRNALKRHADHEAVALLQSALSRAGAQDQAASDGTGIRRCRLLDDLARARQRLGEYEAAYALWSEARDHVGAGEGDFLARIERRMGLSAFWAGRPRDALAHYDRAIELARAHTVVPLVIRSLYSRSTALRSLGEVEAARTDVEEALRLAETTGDASLLAGAHRALLLAYAWTGPAAKAREHAARALEFSRQSGDGGVAWQAHWALALLAGFTGNGAMVAEHSAEADKLARALGSPVLAAWTSEIAVEYASAAGEWSNGIALADRAIGVARGAAERTLLPRLLVWKGLILVARDELATAKQCFDESWELAGADDPSRPDADLHSIIPAHTGRAAWLLAQRDYAGAIRVGEQGLAIADGCGYLAWAIHRLVPAICEASILMGDFARVAKYAARLRRDAGKMEHRLGMAWADAADALLLWRRDADPQAAEGLVRAAVDLESVPFLYHAARLRRNAADVYTTMGDRERALAELRLAHEMFRNMGAERDLRGVREEIRALGARPPQRATPSAGTLTARERDIARLLAERKTNREIGVALDISPRTVSTHLANVFQKLEIDSRGALIDLVREDPNLLEETGAN
jgi:DNA-binding CsgD family transcriptional regulator